MGRGVTADELYVLMFNIYYCTNVVYAHPFVECICEARQSIELCNWMVLRSTAHASGNKRGTPGIC